MILEDLSKLLTLPILPPPQITHFNPVNSTMQILVDRGESTIKLGVVAQWCNPLMLQPEQSGRVGSRRGRASQHLSLMTRGHRLD